MAGSTRNRWFVALACVVGLGVADAPGQTVTWTVTFDDPLAYPAYQPLLSSHLLAAGAKWNQYLRPAGNVTLDIHVGFGTDLPRSSGRSFTSSYLNTVNGFNVYEQGVGAEIRTGLDPNGAAGDVEFRINPNYMQNVLWFDPNPTQQTATVPGNKTDAMSVMLHELGHAIAFNGWRSHTDGSLPGNYMSTFDRNVTFDGSNLFFNGPQAMAQYNGQPVPVTFGNNFHIGNNAPRPGSDLIPDLMNGVVFFNGQRYQISPMDLAILADSSVPVEIPVPEPGLAGVAAVVVVFGWAARRRKAVSRAA